MPKVSVLLPVFNAEPLLMKALTSLLNQTEPDLEIVVIDDGSNDGTSEKIDTLKDPRIRSFKIPHGGISKALNYGLAQCSGEYIARMDADDLCHPDRIRKQREFLDDHPDIGVVSCQVEHRTVNHSSSTEGYELYVQWQNGLVTPEDHALNRFVDAPVAHPSVMFRQSLVTQFGSYSEENLPEDFELWLRWMDQGIRFAKIPQKLLYWTDHPGRLSRTHPNYSPEAFSQVKSHYFERWYRKNKKVRPIWIWGLGRSVNKRIHSLKVPIAGYIDVKAHQQKNVILYQEIEKMKEILILSYVSDRAGKKKINKYLVDLGKKEGEDFWMMV